jgi:hypothetical protein
MRALTLCLLIIAMAACANATRTGKLRIGMTKPEVVAVMGKPVSFGADRQSEVLYFRLVEGDIGGGMRTFFVRLVEGKVDSFGRIVEPESPSTVVSSLPPPPPPPQ